MRLFFYGVLLEGLGDWPFLKGIGPARAATARGTLYGISGTNGWYPVLVPGEDRVAGAVHDAGGVDIPARQSKRKPISGSPRFPNGQSALRMAISPAGSGKPDERHLVASVPAVL